MLSEYIKNKINEAQELMQNESCQALKIFDEILELEPKNINALNGKGSTLMKMNKFSEAEIFFDKSLSIKENSTALINKGIILKNQKKYNEALNYYNQAIHNNVKIKNIANILKNEIYEITSEDCQNELFNYTNNANKYINQGLDLKNENKLWDALDFYNKAIKEDHTCKEYVMTLINDVKKILQKEFLFNTPKFKNSKIDNLKLQSLRALLIEENPKKSLTLTNLVLEINETDIDTLNQKGFILFLFDEYHDAINYFNMCLILDEDYYYALFNKALVLRILNELNDALDCFDELLIIPELESKVKAYQLEILDKLHKKNKNRIKRN